MSQYFIVIALRGKHFATCDLKLNSRELAEKRFRQVAAKFSPRLGYSITLTEWSIPVGRDLLCQEEIK